jgi:molybdopterin/thiamine biosynthesis adenylyltransferase
MKKSNDQLEQLKHKQDTAAGLYRPEFYRPGTQEGATGFYKLLETPGISVNDTIHDQVKELIKFRNPSQRFSAADLSRLTSEHFAGADPLHYGVWVWYPWSRRLVHLLDELEFIDVRTSRNLYKITREERDLLAKKRIGVIGLSVGQSVSVTLAMERVCGELRLADFDLLELTNLNRIRTGVHNLGLAKVFSVAREIAEIDPFIRVKCFPEGLHENNLDDFFLGDGRLDLLVEESDGFDIKILSRYKARDLKIPVVMEASDRCMVDVERFDLEPDRNILHGIVKHLDVGLLKTLTTNEEKIPYMLDILGFSSTTPRLRASMLEMQTTINTWPQLASAVTMGGGITADVSRRILLNHFKGSGRYYVDIDELIGDKRSTGSAGSVPEQGGQELTAEKMKSLTEGYTGKDELPENVVAAVLEAAAQAPSQANRQPWKWLYCKGRLFLFLDRAKALPYADADGSMSLVSLGCALENAVQQARALGYLANPEIVAGTGDLVAVITFEAAGKDESSLAAQIGKRRTHRGAAPDKAIGESQLEALSEAVQSVEGARVHFISGKERLSELAAIAGACDRVRLLNPVLHREAFSREFVSAAGDIREGTDVRTLMLDQAAENAFQVISAPEVASLLREWNKGAALEKLLSAVVAGSPVAGLITMPGGSPAELVKGGMAAERLWLQATKNNLSLHPICLPLSFSKLLGKKDSVLSKGEVADLKTILNRLSLLFDGLTNLEGVFLFRLFEADAPAIQSLRKPLHQTCFNC